MTMEKDTLLHLQRLASQQTSPYFEVFQYNWEKYFIIVLNCSATCCVYKNEEHKAEQHKHKGNSEVPKH
jgi:hypothetical protein